MSEGPQNTVKSDPKKFHAPNEAIARAKNKVSAALDEFVKDTVLHWANQDMTPRQAKAEFWALLAEYYGVKIEVPHPEGSGG
jgi:hypothetical protein